MRSPTRRRRSVGVFSAVVVTAGLLGACGDSDESSDSTTVTTAATTTTPGTATTTTVPMGSNIESLSYLIQGLLTTEQIGGGWVDQGRTLIPAGSNQLSGFLCPEGETAVASLAGRLDPQVSTSFRRANDVGLIVSETLMWGNREEVVAGFASFVAAVNACKGKYTTTELGEISLGVDQAPKLGTSALAYRFGPASPQTANPWLEQQVTAVLLSDPAQPVALVVTVVAATVHNPPSAKTTTVEPAEFSRIVEAAVKRILDGL